MGESERKSLSCEMDRSREFFHGRVHFSFHDFALGGAFEKKEKCGRIWMFCQVMEMQKVWELTSLSESLLDVLLLNAAKALKFSFTEY